MKKLVLILLVLGTMGCNVMGYDKAKYTIGMTEQEFVHLNKRIKKVYANDRKITIYRMYNGMQSAYGFFAFGSGKLIKYEEGNYLDDYKLMNL
jgi:hypothetical protein